MVVFSPAHLFSSAASLRQFPTGVFLFCSAFLCVQDRDKITKPSRQPQPHEK